MDYREFVSMGPGYSEWETGGDQWWCPDCGHRQDVEYEDVLEEWDGNDFLPPVGKEELCLTEQ
jgi:hypothetical protein